VRGICTECQNPLMGHRKSVTGLCRKCYSARGLNNHGGRSSVPAICFNKNCRLPFACSIDRDPKYSYCPKCIDKRDNQYWSSPNINALY